MRSQKFTPVFLGADLCCYGLARSFREEGYHSFAFGKMKLGATANCPFITYTAVPRLGEKDVLVKTLLDFRKTRDGQMMVIPCTDEYVRLLAENRGILSCGYTVVAPTLQQVRLLADKEEFYKTCDLYRIPYPQTAVIGLSRKDCRKDMMENFSYPAVLKPSDGVDYFRHPFSKMEKVYLIKNEDALEETLAEWRKSGYTGKGILQEYIPGPDDCIHVITFYCDRHADVKAVIAGRVLLEEKTPKGRGNHAAILPEKPPEIATSLASMLERIGYRGICHFDLKYNPTTGKMFVFEINLRPGRSNLYLSAAGCSLAKLLITDLIDNHDLHYCEYYKPTLYHAIPIITVYRYTFDINAAKTAKTFYAKKQTVSALPGVKESRYRPMRFLYRMAHDKREAEKYRKSAVRYR